MVVSALRKDRNSRTTIPWIVLRSEPVSLPRHSCCYTCSTSPRREGYRLPATRFTVPPAYRNRRCRLPRMASVLRPSRTLNQFSPRLNWPSVKRPTHGDTVYVFVGLREMKPGPPMRHRTWSCGTPISVRSRQRSGTSRPGHCRCVPGGPPQRITQTGCRRFCRQSAMLQNRPRRRRWPAGHAGVVVPGDNPGHAQILGAPASLMSSSTTRQVNPTVGRSCRRFHAVIGSSTASESVKP